MQKKLLTVKLEEIFRLIMADLIAQLLEIAKHTLKALPERPPCAPYRVHPRFLPAIQSFLYLHIRKTKTLRGQSRVTAVSYSICRNIIRYRGGSNRVPRVFSLFKMAAAREKTLAHSRSHSRSRVSNEDGDVFKMAATGRTGYEMWLR